MTLDTDPRWPLRRFWPGVLTMLIALAVAAAVAGFSVMADGR